MSHVTTGPLLPAPFSIGRFWHRFRHALRGTQSPREAALRRARREGMPAHLMRDMGLIDTHDPRRDIALMPPGRLHYPYV